MIAPGFARKMLQIIEELGLALIVLATLVSVGEEVWQMFAKRHVELADLLLLFIYLEVIAMVAVYYESHQLPVRFPLYIAMVALARLLILDSKTMEWPHLLVVGVTILVIALAVLTLRFGRARFPSED
jgi:protein PsiE